MIRFRFHLTLAALLLAAQALLPIAHFGRVAADKNWIEVCSGAGVIRLPSDEGHRSPPSHDDHCVLCRLAEPLAGAARIASPPVSARAAIPLATAAPSAAAAAPARNGPPARAPPAQA